MYILLIGTVSYHFDVARTKFLDRSESGRRFYLRTVHGIWIRCVPYAASLVATDTHGPKHASSFDVMEVPKLVTVDSEPVHSPLIVKARAAPPVPAVALNSTAAPGCGVAAVVAAACIRTASGGVVGIRAAIAADGADEPTTPM